MRIKQLQIIDNQDYKIDIDDKINVVLCFGSKQLLNDRQIISDISSAFPNANIAYCSTAGEIYDDQVMDNSISAVAIQFDHTHVLSNSISIDQYSNSFDAGKSLVSCFDTQDLRYIFVLSDGSKVNGSELVKGMNEVIDDHIPITGGLAGDGPNFQNTLVGLNEPPTSGKILALAFYGAKLKISHSSMGGWEPFGLQRLVTKSNANELFEIDGKNALELYKEYLGKYSEELPGSALLFPLSVQLHESENSLVRTILSIDNERKSMLFAGDIPEGSKVRFMKANFDRLIDAASQAANISVTDFNSMQPSLAILVSCVGRKLILSDRIDEEVEAVKDVLGGQTTISGFYSYGEISPLLKGTSCELHNQTMTITCLSEE
ncbi:MAG TPA: FIST N-terminal domain-containing protein [Saprospiraceae bacterium]|nr:FIST N-terminal domain-containing protein [Saprospiraceae bacterium]